MRSRLNRIGIASASQDNAVVPPAQEQELDGLRADLRAAIDESGWKHDALAAEMSLASGLSIDGPYLSKLLSGEKTITASHLASLPANIEEIFNRKRAERSGDICVKPLSGLDAQKAFVAGLIGIMNQPAQLPARASAPARADLASPAGKAVVA